MENQDIRWKQRFSNYRKALNLLNAALAVQEPDVFQQAGLIQFFEVSFELSWKTIKDYLESQGFAEIKTPRETIKKAFEIGLLEEGRTWLTALEDRNLTTHVYDETRTMQVMLLIKHQYAPLLNALETKLLKHVAQ